jgi:hypothetical protein
MKRFASVLVFGLAAPAAANPLSPDVTCKK